MDHVAAVEEVGGHSLAIRLRVLREIDREVEVQARATAWAAAEVLLLVVVLVEVRVVVVPARDRELGARNAVGVMPAERRREPIGRVLDELARCVVRALVREPENAVARPVDHRVGRDRIDGRRLCREVRACERLRKIPEVVLVRPVLGCEQLAGLGVHGGVPEVDVGRVVDRDLPREPKPVRGRLPAQASRDGPFGDAPVGDHRLLGRAVALAENAQVRRVVEVETLGRRLDSLRRPEILVARGARGEAVDEAPGGEDDLAVAADVDRDVASEDLEAPEALVQVHVCHAARRAPVAARDGEVGDVGARYAEIGRICRDVVERDRQRIHPWLGLAGPVRRRHGARHEHERHEGGDEDRKRSMPPKHLVPPFAAPHGHRGIAILTAEAVLRL